LKMTMVPSAFSGCASGFSLSLVLDIFSLLDCGTPSPFDVHYPEVRYVIMNNSYVVLLVPVHDCLNVPGTPWSIDMYRSSPRHTPIHIYTLLVTTCFLSSCIKLCLLLPLSYFCFRSIPSLYNPMFILNLVQHLALETFARQITLQMPFIVHSFRGLVTFHQPRRRFNVSIHNRYTRTHGEH